MLVKLHLALCCQRLPPGRHAHVRSVHSRRFGCSSLRNSDIFPTSPLYLQTPLVEFFEPSRARGVAGSPGVRLPGDLPSISLSGLHRHVVVITHIAHQGTRLKQQQPQPPPHLLEKVERWMPSLWPQVRPALVMKWAVLRCLVQILLEVVLALFLRRLQALPGSVGTDQPMLHNSQKINLRIQDQISMREPPTNIEDLNRKTSGPGCRALPIHKCQTSIPPHQKDEYRLQRKTLKREKEVLRKFGCNFSRMHP